MRWLVVAAVLVACKDKEPPREITKSVNMVNMKPCDLALDDAAAAPLDARPKLLIDNCQVCDWNTIMTWNVEGTKPETLQKALEGCNAFCTGDSKMKFIAAADQAKGTSNDTPWRRLAEACGERVDAAKDHRFMSAP
ncbi:MAG TPA: hypothetical protein VL326_37540, partial [Kofleriaceae bacterium]|nr:hypothetical protein [Kofleriaceae bacterium]